MDELKTKREDFIKRFRASQQRKKERLAVLERCYVMSTNLELVRRQENSVRYNNE